MVMLVVAVLLFAGTHLIHAFAPGFRQSMINRLGENGWKGVFSLAALAEFVFLVFAFGKARQGGVVLYDPPFWLAHLTVLLMLIAMICLSASFFPPGKIAAFAKHPMVLSVKIWAFSPSSGKRRGGVRHPVRRHSDLGGASADRACTARAGGAFDAQALRFGAL